MTIQSRIRCWLGITDLHDRIGYLDNKLMHAQHCIDKTQTVVSTIAPGLGRVIAKLDAKYAEPELDPKRRAESDKLAEETLRRLHAEHLARAPYNDPEA